MLLINNSCSFASLQCFLYLVFWDAKKCSFKLVALSQRLTLSQSIRHLMCSFVVLIMCCCVSVKLCLTLKTNKHFHPWSRGKDNTSRAALNKATYALQAVCHEEDIPWNLQTAALKAQSGSVIWHHALSTLSLKLSPFWFREMINVLFAVQECDSWTLSLHYEMYFLYLQIKCIVLYCILPESCFIGLCNDDTVSRLGLAPLGVPGQTDSLNVWGATWIQAAH